MNAAIALVRPDRGADRKERILAAANACFDRLGLDGTRVEDILREAGVSRATFYRHYDNIDAVLMRLTVRAAREMMALAVASSIDAETCKTRRIARVVAEMAGRSFDPPILAMIAQSAEMVRVSNLIMVSEDDMAVLSEPLVPLLEDAIAAGALRADIGIGRMIEWLTRNTTSIRYRLPPWAREIPELVDYAMDFVMPALLHRPGAELKPVLERLDGIEARLRSIEGNEGKRQ